MLTWDDIKNTSKENAWKMLYSAGQTLGTPIVKSLANIGALGATGWGAIQMARNKPESAEKAFNKALTARQFAGTEGSFDQGIESGKNTLLRGTLSAGQTALTGLGLPYVTPGKLATAGVIGGGLNKVMGGEFSTGAGQAMGSLPQILGFVAKSNPILAKYLPKSSGVTNRILGSVGNVTQGVGMDLARGMPTTPTSMAIDAITGAMGGTSQFDTPKVSKTGIVGDQSIKPEEVKPIIKGFRLKTDAPAYDALLNETKTAANGKPLKQYYAEEKGQIGKIEYLTPDEYLKRTAKGFNKSVEELIQGRGNKYAEQYAEQMKNGIEFDMPYLDYSHKRFNQEGVNRAMAAKLAGIEKIPTLIVEDTPQNYVYKSTVESKEIQTPKIEKNDINLYKAIDTYQNWGYSDINNYLRGKKDVPKDVGKYVEAIDNGFKELPNKPVYVFRSDGAQLSSDILDKNPKLSKELVQFEGKGHDWFYNGGDKEINKILSKLVGKKYTEPGYLSTTGNKEILNNFSDGGDISHYGIPAHITIQGNSKVLNVGELGFTDKEAEYLLPRNTTLEIVSARLRPILRENYSGRNAEKFILDLTTKIVPK